MVHKWNSSQDLATAFILFVVPWILLKFMELENGLLFKESLY